MTTGGRDRIERRVVEVAEAALTERGYVSAIDVLTGLGWLHPSNVDRWRKGRVDYLERVVFANLAKISAAMKAFRRWARGRGLKPSEIDYLARRRGRRQLRFSKTGQPEIERGYRTHWISPEFSERERTHLSERQGRPPDWS